MLLKRNPCCCCGRFKTRLVPSGCNCALYGIAPAFSAPATIPNLYAYEPAAVRGFSPGNTALTKNQVATSQTLAPGQGVATFNSQSGELTYQPNADELNAALNLGGMTAVFCVFDLFDSICMCTAQTTIRFTVCNCAGHNIDNFTVS